MNTKGTKFLAVLAVLAMAFAGFAVISEVQTSDATSTIELAGENKSGTGYDYVVGATKTLTLTADIPAATMFAGTDILAGEGTTADMMTAHGFVVKKTIGAVTTYSSSVSGAFSTIVNDKATAAAATAAPVSVVLLADAEEDNGIKTSSADVTTKYVAVNFDLNGKTLSHTNAGGLTGVSSLNKFIYIDDNQIVKITNGTIKSALTYANIETKDVAFALIQTYGPLTLGDGNSALTLDISGVKTAAPEGVAPQNLAVGVLYTSATSVVNANVTIDAGKNVALYAVYGASNNAGWYQTANGGTDTKENSTTGVKVTVKNGASINGEVGAVYYKANAAYGLDTITTGADLTIDGGTFSGKVVDNLPIYNNGNEVPAVADSVGAVKTKVSIAGGTFSDVAALSYMTADSTAKVVAGDKEIPKPTTKPVDIDGDASGTVIPASGTVIYDVKADITKLPTAAITADVVFQAGAADDVAFDTLTVKDTGSVSFVGMNSVSGVVKTTDGTSSQTFELDGFKGTLTVTKGSIIINAQEWIDGDIILDKDAVAKISGTVEGDVNISYGAATGSAKVIIEAGDAKSLTIADGCSLTIKANIDVEINGKVIGEDVTDSKLDVKAAKSVVINSGAVIDKVKFDNADKAVTVYSGADVNTSAFTAFALIAGKDAASGTWSYSGTTLTLNNYNGTYNFKQISATVTKIVLIGDNVVSYAVPENYVAQNLFGTALASIETDSVAGTLAVNVDVSKAAGAILAGGLSTVFNSGATLAIDEVGLTVTVTGSNNEWTVGQIAGFQYEAIKATTGINMLKSNVNVDALSALATERVLGISSGAISVKATTVDVKGDMTATTSLAVANSSTLKVTGTLAAKDLTNKQESTVTVGGAILSSLNATSAYNNANMTVSGDSQIIGTFTNKAVFTNSGNMLILGTAAGGFVQETGTFTNTGTIKVPAKYIAEGNTKTLTITNDEIPAAETSVKLKSVTIATPAVVIPGTSASVTASVVFEKTDGVNDNGINTALDPIAGFTGTIASTQNGTGYTLSLSKDTITINIAYDGNKTENKIGSKYSVSASGTVVDGLTSRAITANATDKAVEDTGTVLGLLTNNACSLTVTGGKLVNEGVVTVSAGPAAFLGAEAEFDGNLTSDIPAITLAGTFKGDLASNGTGLVTISGNMTGNIDAKGQVTLSGATKTMTGNIKAIKAAPEVDDKVYVNNKKLEGNIETNMNVEIGKELKGDVLMNNSDVSKRLTLTAAKMNGTLTYATSYNATATATTKTDYTATMVIDAAGSVIINATKGNDADAETAVKAGYFTLGTIGEAATDQTISLKVTAGTIAVDTESKTLKDRYELVIESGATIEVGKVYTLDVTKAALKVSKDAIKNFETGSAAAVTYGKVLSVMSFDIDGGAYTIYSNVAYALANCDEGDISVLTSDTIGESVDVKKGVNVLVGDGVTLTFDGKNVTMGEGAKITISGTGKVVFNASGNNGEPADAEWVFFSVSGNIVFGDNVIALDGVRFSGVATIQGVAAADPAPAKISAVLPYNQGTATLIAGTGVGTITLGQTHYNLSATATAASKFSGTFVVAEGATYEATGITDVAKNGTTDIASTVTINGTLKATNGLEVKGTYSGSGSIVLPNTKAVTVSTGSISLKVTDENGTGYILENVKKVTTEPVPANLVITATKSGDDEYVVLSSVFDAGKITATGAAKLDGLTVNKDATVIADVVDLITADSTANGIVKTKTLNNKAAVTGNKDLAFDATYKDGDYTVYTKIVNIDLKTVKDITLNNGYNLGAGELALDEDGVTVTVPAGKKIVITTGKLVVGVPATSLGAGSVIKGAVEITGAGYVVVYSTVDATGAHFYSTYDAAHPENNVDAVVSNFDIEGTPYAAVYANNVNAPALGNDDPATEGPAADVKPAIKGYTFTKWKTYNGAFIDDAKVGVDVTASLVAQKVVVKATFLDGVQYYCNGVLYDAVGIDNKVTVGSIFTAKIVDYSKYQGTPLVNGQNAFEVTEDATLTVTGVSPVEPEPAPAPAGMSLTEILLIVLVVLIAIMVVIIALRLNRS